eukprot:749548-Hanusia_phi.AAC.1
MDGRGDGMEQDGVLIELQRWGASSPSMTVTDGSVSPVRSVSPIRSLESPTNFQDMIERRIADWGGSYREKGPARMKFTSDIIYDVEEDDEMKDIESQGSDEIEAAHTIQ